MSYFAIVYACTLAVSGALLVWLLSMTFIAITEALTARANARRAARGNAMPEKQPRYRPLPPRIPGIHLTHGR